MSSLSTISGQQAQAAFLNEGWSCARHRGSHMILISPGHIADF